MIKVLVSACLLGEKVRYSGKDAYCDNKILIRWSKEGRLISFCPEMSAGFPAPRPPSEIVGVGGGQAVLDGKAKIINCENDDVTEGYKKGAELALKLAVENDVKVAILKDGSPSCGSYNIYDGQFSGNKIEGMGITATLLRNNGIEVFTENTIDEAEIFLKKIGS